MWKNGIATLVASTNMFVMLSGLGMTRNGFGWHERSVLFRDTAMTVYGPGENSEQQLEL